MAQITLAGYRTLTDGVTSAGSAVLTSASAAFLSNMVGAALTIEKASAGTTAADGVMSSTITPHKLTSISGLFTADMVGEGIIVAGAGAAGADLVTTIATYTSATEVQLTAVALTDVAAANVSIYDSQLASSIVSVQSATQITLATTVDIPLTAATFTISMGAGPIDFATEGYEVVAFSSNLGQTSSISVQLILPDGQGAVDALDVTGTIGLSHGNPCRFFVGGPTYRFTKNGTQPAGLYADVCSRPI